MFKNMFKVKFDTNTNSNMQNSMVAPILFVLDWKLLTFLVNLVQKNRNCQFKLIIGT